jgi:hypothetical protein
VKGRCACGTITLELARPPEWINQCDCSVCFRLGAAWGYFPTDEVTIRGETAHFIRTDVPQAHSAFHFCPACGSTTHWSRLEGSRSQQTGINMRLFEPDELYGIEVRFSNGLRQAPGGPLPPARHEPITIRNRWPI